MARNSKSKDESSLIEKMCFKCEVKKPVSDFFRDKRYDFVKYRGSCQSCVNENNAKSYYNHRKKILAVRREKSLNQSDSYKELRRKRAAEYARNKRKCDPNFKLRNVISCGIKIALMGRGRKKDGSITKYLPYTIQELRCHLESLWESWMNWANYGCYRVDNWDDNDLSTWKWNIDHIIPQSDFQFLSMSDEAFLECWSLDNLRPLSSKLNNAEGSARTRHNNKKYKFQ